ncbi:unnamed protein product [Calypogeia fissa]
MAGQTGFLFLGAPSAEQVARDFVNHYYNTLSNDPQLVLPFYRVTSTITRIETGIDGTVDSTTMSIYDFEEKLKAMDYSTYDDTDTFTVDSQLSLMGGILVNVMGCVKNNNSRRRFVQTFFLVPQEVGYFVHNDIFRYLEKDDSETFQQELIVSADFFEELLEKDDSETFQELIVSADLFEELIVADELFVSEPRKPLSRQGEEEDLNATTSTPESTVVAETVNSVDQEEEESTTSIPEVKSMVDQIISSVTNYYQEVSPISAPEMELAGEEMVAAGGNQQEADQEVAPTSTLEVELAAEETEGAFGNFQKEVGQEVAPTATPEMELGAEETVSLVGDEEEGSTTTIEKTLEEAPKQVLPSFSYASVLKMEKKVGGGSTFPSTKSLTSQASAQTKLENKVSNADSQASYSFRPTVSTTARSVLKNKVSPGALDGRRTVYVKNLPLDISTSQLEGELTRFGLITAGGVIIQGQQDGICYAFVRFKDSASAQNAIGSSPISFGGRTVYIQQKPSVSRA